MKELMREAHKMTKEIKKEFPSVDYKAQLGLCMSYLLNNKEDKVTLETVEKAAVAAVGDLGMDNWSCNAWVKENYDRVYFEVFYYKGGRKRATKCGYWDNVENKYVAYAYNVKCYDLINKKYV